MPMRIARLEMLHRRFALWLRLLPLLGLAGGAHAADAPALDLENRAGRVVVVDFWASWCVPCRRSFPWLNEMQAKYRDQGLVVIGVNVDTARADAEKFLAAVPAHFEIVYDPDGELPAKYGVTAMPSSFLFDRSGKLATRHLGFQNARRSEYEAALRQLLQTTRTARVVDARPALVARKTSP